MNKNELQKFNELEKLQQQTLFYVRAILEALQPGKKIIPEVWLDSQDVMLMLKWSRSTLKRRRKDGTLAYKKIKQKLYYSENEVLKLIAEGGA